MLVFTGIASTLGLTSISLLLVLMGLLSRRLGQVTEAAAYYRGFFAGAALVAVGVLVRLLHLFNGTDVAVLHHKSDWVLLYAGFPALGMTLGVVFAWRYWSWLLAERD